MCCRITSYRVKIPSPLSRRMRDVDEGSWLTGHATDYCLCPPRVVTPSLQRCPRTRTLFHSSFFGSRSRAMFNPFTEIAEDDPADAALVEQAKHGDRAA